MPVMWKQHVTFILKMEFQKENRFVLSSGVEVRVFDKPLPEYTPWTTSNTYYLKPVGHPAQIARKTNKNKKIGKKCFQHAVSQKTKNFWIYFYFCTLSVQFSVSPFKHLNIIEKHEY